MRKDHTARGKIKTLVSQSLINITLLICLEFSQNCDKYGVELIILRSFVFLLASSLFYLILF